MLRPSLDKNREDRTRLVLISMQGFKRVVSRL